MNSNHTCNGAASTTGYKATRNWVANIIKEKSKVLPQYKFKDIIIDIKRDYRIHINYFQAWRGKEIAKEQLVGSFTDAYSQLPIFCEKILKVNPGSYSAVAVKDDSSFQGLFISFRASLVGFLQGCRPLLFLDSIFLKSKYQETILSATAAVGDDKVFPVAFAIVDVENDYNWHWCVNQLKCVLGVCGLLTFVADREKVLKESIPGIFPDSFRGYCLLSLGQQLLREIKMPFSFEVKRILISELYSSAYAPRPEEFHKYVESIKKISPEAYLWIEQSESLKWPNILF